MNLTNELTTNEREILKDIGIIIEEREYREEEIEKYKFKSWEYIISHSTKNNDINRLSRTFNNIWSKIIKD